MQDAFPSRVVLNGTECQVMIVNNLNIPIPGAAELLLAPFKAPSCQSSCMCHMKQCSKLMCAAEPPGLVQPHLAESATQPVSARNGQLYGVDGKALTIKGVNWFGFETSVTAVHGLWQVQSPCDSSFITYGLPSIAHRANDCKGVPA